MRGNFWTNLGLIESPKVNHPYNGYNGNRAITEESIMAYEVLENDRHVPSLQPIENAVNWSIFRRRKEAENYVDRVRLESGYELIGGHSQDSVGDYWWAGVRVKSLSGWGSRQAINKHGRHGD
ncbi:MAG: hypothetical protein ACYDEV_00905 [Acidiferrobacter sp.]